MCTFSGIKSQRHYIIVCHEITPFYDSGYKMILVKKKKFFNLIKIRFRNIIPNRTCNREQIRLLFCESKDYFQSITSNQLFYFVLISDLFIFTRHLISFIGHLEFLPPKPLTEMKLLDIYFLFILTAIF